MTVSHNCPEIDTLCMDYTCEKCGDVLASRDSLKQHYSGVHDTRYEETLDDTEDCPTCGKPYETKQQMKIHHSKAHDESLSMVEVTCDWCGDSHERQESQIADQEKTFCDQECHGAWESENMVAEDHPNYNSVEVECDFCGGSLTRAESEIHGNVFCDDDCMAGWLSENRAGENHPLYSKKEVECAWCEKTIVRKAHDIERAENNFCSRECKGEWKSENRVGEDNPQWKGCEHSYSGGWQKVRREAIERAGGTCEVPDCDRTESENGKSLEAHHIIPWRLFDDDEEAHKLSNLLVLCREHHMEIEPRYYKTDG